MSRHRFRAGLLSLVAATMLLASACGDDIEITRPAAVLLVGDSILAQASDELSAALRDEGWHPIVDSRPGSAISGEVIVPEGWPERISNLVRVSKPDVVVVELGTNGCGSCPSLAAGIDGVMEELHGVERVYWLNVKEHAPIPERPAALNEALDAATDRWDNLEVLDMNERFGDDPALTLADDIHLSPEGVHVLAQLVVDALPDID